jgi:phosphate transport system substrate-binding protein
MLIGCCTVASAEPLRVGGTGAATGMIPVLAAAVPAGENLEIEVVPSLGSSGGLQAVHDGVIDIAASGRPLKPEEKARGLVEAMVVRTPFVLVTSNRQPGGFKSTEIAGLYRSPNATWPDGSRIRIILRPKSDSDTPLLGAMFPDMAAAIEAARQRPEIPIAATDQDNIALAERVQGSLAGSSFTQIQTEQPTLQLVAINGVKPSLETFERGSYPFTKNIYFVLSAKRKPAAERFVAFLNSPEGLRALRAAGNLPATE